MPARSDRRNRRPRAPPPGRRPLQRAGGSSALLLGFAVIRRRLAGAVPGLLLHALRLFGHARRLVIAGLQRVERPAVLRLLVVHACSPQRLTGCTSRATVASSATGSTGLASCAS